MAIHDLKGQLARTPEQPGVYLFLDDEGETLYVGKARVLRDRVRSYLGAAGLSPRHEALVREAARIETIVTDSVVEALALENRLIKQRNPRFNVLLRDDKTYPYLQLTTSEPAPRLLVARRVARDGNVYAGPFMPAAVARRTMSLAHRLFGIRSCNEVIDGQRDRPCLEYDIGRCLAPCVASICSLERYGQAVDEARLLLDGRQEELVERLTREMTEAAADERFEHAAHVRDAIRTVETLRHQRNKMETPAAGDRDAFGVHVGTAGAIVEIFQMRGGRVVERVELATDAAGSDAGPGPARLMTAPGDTSVAEVLTAALQHFYADYPPPPEVHVPEALDVEEHGALEAWLSARAERRVRLRVPQRGDRRGLLDLAIRNAAVAYQTRFAEGPAAAFEALETLRTVLVLPALPRRIEAFDISTLQGSETVASMVVCVEGRMRPGDYRKFRVRGLGDGRTGGADQESRPHAGPDDFAAMAEVVLRRYRRLLDRGGPFPDLIVIDGGKGQLRAAYDALRQVGLERLVAVGLAKVDELLFVRDRPDGIALPAESPALRLLQRIRDEAHRFAVTFHRRSRRARDLGSELDRIPGVGPRRRIRLLRTFGSLAGVRRASLEELRRVVDARTAEAIVRHFSV